MADQLKPAAQALDEEIVRQICGDLLDETVAAILELQASLADLEIAAAWLQGEDDVMGEERKPLEGAAAEIYDLLITEEDVGDER